MTARFFFTALKTAALAMTTVTAQSNGAVLPLAADNPLADTPFETTTLSCAVAPDTLSDGFASIGFPVDVPLTCQDDFCYYTYIPPTCTNRREMPLVLDLHGTGSCPLFSAAYTGWATLATFDCFAVVWPVGHVQPNINNPEFDNSCWHFPGGVSFSTATSSNETLESPDCCCFDEGIPVDTQSVNDAPMLRSVLVHAVQSLNNNTLDEDASIIDATRVYVTGHSNGCIASLALAATSSDLVAAVACMAGTLIQRFDSEDYTPVPIWMMHGGLDLQIPIAGLRFTDQYAFLPLETAAQYMARRNGCNVDNVAETPILDGLGTRVTRAVNCSSAPVVYIVLDASGHAIYALGTEQNATLSGANETTVDTTRMAWNFAREFSKDAIPEAFVADDSTDMDLSTGAPTFATTAAPISAPSTIEPSTDESNLDAPTADTEAPSVPPTQLPTFVRTAEPIMLDTTSASPILRGLTTIAIPLIVSTLTILLAFA